MRAQRARRPARLALVPGTAERAEEAAPAAARQPCSVIQNQSLTDAIRLVVLHGDPQAPFDTRVGIAVIELLPGHWSPEERLEIITFFQAKADAKWEEEQRTRGFVEDYARREALQLVSREGRRRARRDGGAA